MSHLQVTYLPLPYVCICSRRIVRLMNPSRASNCRCGLNSFWVGFEWFSWRKVCDRAEVATTEVEVLRQNLNFNLKTRTAIAKYRPDRTGTFHVRRNVHEPRTSVKSNREAIPDHGTSSASSASSAHKIHPARPRPSPHRAYLCLLSGAPGGLKYPPT